MSSNLVSKNCGNVIKSNDFNSFVDQLLLNGIHEVGDSNSPYHILVNNINSESNYILVGFHGLLDRKKIILPAFFFRGVSNKVGISLISFSDPSLNFSENLSLSWYLGNDKNGNITEKIANLLDMIITKTGKKLILAGGSGGGFAALNIHNHMKLGDNAVTFVWNPQTNIIKYNLPIIKKYFKICVEDKENIDLKYIEEELIKKNIPYKLKVRNDLQQLIFINGYDHAHLRKHVRPYIINQEKSKNKVYIGDWGYGHIQPDQNTIVNVIKSISENLSFDSIIENIVHPKKTVLNFDENIAKLESVIDCRVSIIKANPKRIICLKSNLYDHFIGYQSLFLIRNSKGEVVFKSDYLFGANVCELYINTSIEKIRTLNDSIVELQVEDIKGNKKIFDFRFNKIKELHDCELKI
ncbi:hypothetical protein ACUXVT_11335 [Acinetobacter soli]|uniref:hypothetical protein n=1 Tax=Acinetobacter soli TaxID=487316 RepID=UPI004056D2D6